MHQFWLGPAGRLRPLPSPSLSATPEATAERFGAVHRALDGTPTVDLLGRRRRWVLTWPYLDPETAAYLDVLAGGYLDGPLWLLDPERPNLLSPRVASGGSTARDATGFTASAGTLVFSRSAVPPEPALPLVGGLAWTVPLARQTLRTAGLLPVLPGQDFLFSVWCQATVPVSMRGMFYDQAGEFVAGTGTEHLSIPEWTRMHTWLTPPEWSVYYHVELDADVIADGGQVLATGWQAEHVTVTGWDPDPVPNSWTPGGGAAVVVVESLTTSYPVPGSKATTLVLLER